MYNNPYLAHVIYKDREQALAAVALRHRLRRRLNRMSR